ncbi:RNA polymerase sigma factor [Streptomyces sp. MMBL 11-3]|uniref:RNA polymerase sigma factor n=1 Tax=Streptomyces sp. MMBL 11-3 TaxID=3382639 RepID=UPI0039B3D7E6
MVDQSTKATTDLADLYAFSQPKLVAYARNLLTERRIPPSVLDAEDVAQEAFLTAYSLEKKIRSPEPFIYQVIRNHVRNTARQRERRQELEIQRAVDPNRFDRPVCADFSNLVTNRIAVHRALEQLPTRQRTAVWVAKAEGHTQAETAHIMAARSGTVATHVSRASKALSACLTAACVILVATFTSTVGRPLTSRHTTPGAPTPSPRDVITGQGGLSVILIMAALLLSITGALKSGSYILAASQRLRIMRANPARVGMRFRFIGMLLHKDEKWRLEEMMNHRNEIRKQEGKVPRLHYLRLLQGACVILWESHLPPNRHTTS